MSTNAPTIADGELLLPGCGLRSGPGSALARVPQIAMALFATYRSYRAFRRAEQHLMALDDRMLKDIGIDRSEITSALINRNGERRNGAGCQF
jgi:uncharacterized protein YjiS (DUF1127 family)